MNTAQQTRMTAYRAEISNRTNVSRTIAAMAANPDFQDAVAGIALLYSWDFEAMIDRPAFDIEIRRAVNVADNCAEVCGVQRSHTNRDSASLTDGDVIRYLMHAANVHGDWAFIPAMRVAGTIV